MVASGLGPMMQAAYVVEDIDAAIAQWAGLGLGPFLVVRNMRYDLYEFERSVGDIELSVAFAYSGDLQIELIQQHCDTPSVYRSAEGALLLGLNHLGTQTVDFEADERRMTDAGFILRQRAVSNATGIEVRYYAGAQASLVELIRLGDGGQFFEFLKNQARHWDGVSPYLDLPGVE